MRCSVGLLRADDRVFEAMLDRWRTQQLARGLTTAHIKTSCRVVTRFQEHTNEYPSTWRPHHFEEFLADLRSSERPLKLSTLRSYTTAIRGNFGAVQVRWAKGMKGSGPRRRTVLTTPEFDWVVDLLKHWLSAAGRELFATAERSRSLWPSERAGATSLRTFERAFARAREQAGLPDELTLHCLRHSYVTHLIEAGYDLCDIFDCTPNDLFEPYVEMRAAATANAPKRPEDIGIKPGSPIARRVRVVPDEPDS